MDIFQIVDHVAKKRFNIKEEELWGAFHIRWVDEHILCEGSSFGFYKTGKRKGDKKWDKKDIKTFIVTPAEIEEAEKEFDKNMGFCHKCKGTGTFLERPCSRCKGVKHEVLGGNIC